MRNSKSKKPDPDALDELQEKLRRFMQARDWEQFHTPKNLAMALAGEAGELLEIFQWLTPAEAASIMRRPVEAERVRDEIADVFAYILRLADVLEIDLAKATRAKLRKNARKYPVALARGHARKYTELKAVAPKRPRRSRPAR